MTKENIIFKKATVADKAMIHNWWTKPHVVEFWDNSDSLWQNCEDYLDKGIIDLFDYYIGYLNNKPFSLLMTSIVEKNADENDIFAKNASDNGITRSIDFMIGNEEFLGKGLAHQTLIEFMNFFKEDVTRFLIDPATHNKRAVHVYQKAGFKEIDRYTPKTGSFTGIEHILMQCER